MKILILSANTGNGHNSVMESIYSHFDLQENQVELFPFFYEELMPSNQVMSDFYNLLQVKSFEMCRMYTQMSTLKNQEGIRRTYSYWREPLKRFFDNHPCDAIISTAPVINPYVTRFLRETKSSTPFYIIVTDPFQPIYPGFAEKGADGYFVPNHTVRELLQKGGIEESKIIVSGYPLSKRFLYSTGTSAELGAGDSYVETRKTILVNCGAQGSYHYLSIIDELGSKYGQQANILVICGKNKTLYQLCRKKACVLALGYVEDMRGVLEKSDLCITKAGANTFYECLYTHTPVLVDATRGLLYQEEGVVSFLQENKVGEVFSDLTELQEKTELLLEDQALAERKENCRKLNLKNGSEVIVDAILHSCGKEG